MNLQQKNVNKNSSDLKRIESLLQNSFPEVERFPMDLILYKLEKDIGNLLAIYDNDNFIGFTYLIQYNNLTYVQYLAVDDNYQSMGYGSKILQFINEKYGMNPIILNIEIVDPTFENYLQRKKRKNFYKKNEFNESGLIFKDRWGTYEVMVNNEFNINKSDFINLMKCFVGTSLFLYLEIVITDNELL